MEPTHPEYQGSGPSEEPVDPSVSENQQQPPKERSRSWYENKFVQKVGAPGVIAAGLAAGAAERAYAQELPGVHERPQVRLEVAAPSELAENAKLPKEVEKFFTDRGATIQEVFDPNDDQEDHFIIGPVYKAISPEEVSELNIKLTPDCTFKLLDGGKLVIEFQSTQQDLVRVHKTMVLATQMIEGRGQGAVVEREAQTRAANLPQGLLGR